MILYRNCGTWFTRVCWFRYWFRNIRRPYRAEEIKYGNCGTSPKLWFYTEIAEPNNKFRFTRVYWFRYWFRNMRRPLNIKIQSWCTLCMSKRVWFSCGVITRQLPFWCRVIGVWVLRCLSHSTKDELVCDFLSLVALNGRELAAHQQAIRGKTQWSSSRMFSAVVYETSNSTQSSVY